MPSYLMEGTNYGPSFRLNYLAPGQSHIGPTPTFSRASTKKYFNSAGVLSTASINTIAEDYEAVGMGWVYRGPLIEKQSTNHCAYSESVETGGSWVVRELATTPTTGAGTWVDGSTNCVKLVPSVVNTTYHGVSGPFANVATIGATATISIFAKAAGYNFVWLRENSYGAAIYGINLATGVVAGAGGADNRGGSRVYVGDGWWRISLSVVGSGVAIRIGVYVTPNSSDPSSATAGNGTDGVLVTGGQIEPGAQMTSYISNNGAGTTTRSADVWQLTGSNFSSIWGATEGSVYVNADNYALGTAGILSANDNTSNERIELYSSGTDPKMIVVDGGATQADIDSGAIVNNTNFKLAARYKANDFAITDDGPAVVTDVSGTIPTPTQLDIGKDQAGNYLNGHIREVKIYTTGISDTLLQRLATP